ncbi:hypothetical protein EU96_1028 [Prochlorococcus marinus str. MIT 9302]|uniref:Uncharacterized protein n=1 Tax=Prochlorococcus marinus str. MIT 9302 TaxID=74545 RepID=A0A0A2A902_PROMR|nr:hypothetical protein EU96_1028 [Prochlorococcus marinus str. MIT 9302]
MPSLGLEPETSHLPRECCDLSRVQLNIGFFLWLPKNLVLYESDFYQLMQ